jgi:hypothetical protein
MQGCLDCEKHLMTGGVAQVGKHLLCNHKALSSNPSLMKNEQQKNLLKFKGMVKPHENPNLEA